ncbi:MAG: GNAT family N-acetyltransferase [Hyphomicrobiaceae bacterium]
MAPSTETLRPFHRGAYHIGTDRMGASLSLDALTPDEAAELGKSFAAMDPWLSYGLSAAALGAFFSRVEPDVVRYAIRRGGVLAGVVIVRTVWLHGPYLWFVGLLDAHQSCGTGANILAWLEGEARTAGARNLWLCVSEINTRARAVYEHKGFRLVGDLDGLTADHMTELLMRKRLLPVASPNPPA